MPAPVSNRAPPERQGPSGDCAAVGRLFLNRTLPQPRGHTVEVVLTAALGHTLEESHDYAHCIEGPGAAWWREYEGSVVLLVVRPDGASSEQTLAALEAFLEDRPRDEWVAMALWDRTLRGVDLPTRDRARSLMRLRVALTTPPVEVAVDAQAVLEQASAWAQVLAGGGQALMRSIVLWAPGEREDIAAPVRTRGGRSVLFLGLSPLGPDLREAAQLLARELDQAFQRGFYGVGQCGESRIQLAAGTDSLDVLLPGLPDEFAHGPGCAPDLTAIQGFPSLDAVALRFEDTQRDRYDALVAAGDKSDFDLALRWHSALPFVAARAHLRGQSSLDCVRKSYAVDLNGGALRPFFPGLASDELHLLSMCLDQHYVDQLTGDRIMRELGLFPLSFQLTSLMLDDAPQGLYLVLQKPADALERGLPMLHSVIRRDIDIDNKPPSVMYTRTDDADALLQYEKLVSDLTGLAGQALLDQLESRLDLTQFLTWLALMSLLENGDYVDELIFYATDTVDAHGESALYYSVMGWDPDDLFSGCHHQGRFAIVDPHGLLYCAEGVLEHTIFADALVYARYVEVLEQLLDRVDQALFERTLDGAVNEVLPFLADDAHRAAMVEFVARFPEAQSAEGAKQVVMSGAAAMKQAFQRRAALLRERIQAYRSL